MAGSYTRMTVKKCLLIVAWGVTLFAIGFGISFYRGVGEKFDEVVNVPITEINLEELADGTYTGEYTYETLYAKVSVIVKGADIKKITIEDFVTEKGQDAENIIDSIVDENSVMVDDISGATDSSRVIKLAVINALEQTPA
ncbi:MAG: FMN-binding protein [Clostridiales bacterium]|nr:FMN-binding protein [Clostridiales bacterium]